MKKSIFILLLFLFTLNVNAQYNEFNVNSTVQTIYYHKKCATIEITDNFWFGTHSAKVQKDFYKFLLATQEKAQSVIQNAEENDIANLTKSLPLKKFGNPMNPKVSYGFSYQILNQTAYIESTIDIRHNEPKIYLFIISARTHTIHTMQFTIQDFNDFVWFNNPEYILTLKEQVESERQLIQ